MRRYGKWNGNPRGCHENKAHCVVEVADGWHSQQCARKRGHGPGGLYCKQHAKILAAGKKLDVPEDV